MLLKPRFRPVLALILLIVVGLACNFGQGDDPEPTAEPAATEAPAEAPVEEPTEAPEPTEEPEPTATADPTEGFESYSSEEFGISLAYPADWAIEEFFFISLASSEALLTEGPEGKTEGAVMLVFSAPVTEYTSADPLDIVNEAVEELLADEPDAVLGEPEALTINGQEAARASISAPADDGTPLQGWLYAIVNGDFVGVVFGATPEVSVEEYLPLIEAIAGTVEVSEPAVVLEEPEVEVPEVEMVELRQWASSAVASSEYSNPGWSAMQAAGERDTFECGDITTAWASASSNSVETLELTYDTPVIPTQVIVAQTYNPNQVVLIELRDVDGNYHELYTGEPVEEDCPFVMALTVNDADYLADGIRITIDQSVLGNWNEIDAVELVGMVPGDETPPTQEEATAPGETPAGFLWRVGGETGFNEDEFGAVGGMDTDAAGNVYIADNLHGVYVFDSAGNQVNNIDLDEFNNVADVKVGPDGNLYIADWGGSGVYVLSPEGEILANFGEEGTGEGQFGTFSPQALAVGPDGRIYVHDDNEDEAGEDYERIQVFLPDGTFQSAFNIGEDFFSLSGMDFGPDGNLYMVGFIGDGILQYGPEGDFMALLGEEALSFNGPQGLFIDDDGFFYVTTWSDTPVMKLDPDGNLVGSFGLATDEGGEVWGEGGFYQPGGIAGLGDGSVIFVSDWSGIYSFVTAFSFVE